MNLTKIFEAIQALPAQIAALWNEAKDTAAKLEAALQRATAAEDEVKDLKSKIADLESANASLTSERDTAISQATAKDSEITTLKASAKTVEQQATEQVAALGIDPLPAAAGNGTAAETETVLRARLATTKCPKERAALARKLRDL